MSGPVVGDPTASTDPRKVVAVASIARALLELWRADDPEQLGAAIQAATRVVFTGLDRKTITRETQRLAMVRLLIESDREEPEPAAAPASGAFNLRELADSLRRQSEECALHANRTPHPADRGYHLGKSEAYVRAAERVLECGEGWS